MVPRRRRLKKKVRYTLFFIVIFALFISLRGWRVFASDTKDNIEIQVEERAPVPINQIVENSDSDIPEAAKFDKVVNNFMHQWSIAGASVAIMKDGNLIYSKGYGYADVENGVPTEVKHIFRVASVSKLITAVGIMKLVEQGRLRLDDKVFSANGLLPEYDDYRDKRIESITVEHLLRHQAGFGVGAGDAMFDGHKMGLELPMSVSSLVRYSLKRGLRYSPGKSTIYSNIGYLVLESIIEKVTNQPYQTFIKDEILAPAECFDMHIGHNLSSQRHENEVRYYEQSDAEPIPSADGSGRLLPKSNGGNNVELFGGAGGWVASPVELVRFVASIDPNNPHSNVLSRESIKSMTICEKSRLPIGWMGVTANDDWWRSGSMAGTSAMVRRQSNGYTWAFITNTSNWKGYVFSRMINDMMRKAFDKVAEWPEKDLFSKGAVQE